MRLISAFMLAIAVLIPALADEGKAPISRVAFGSCAHQERDQPIWDHVLATKPELFLSLGDNIYADTQDPEVMKAKYDKQAKKPGYAMLVKTCPILATWDDHDYGGEDAGEEYPKKKESQQLFLDFFAVPKASPRRTQEGIYHSTVFGPADKRVQVIMLDARYFRSALKKDPKRPKSLGQYVPVTDENATMLGKAQWKWLEEQLKIPAEVRLIGSSVQVVAEDHGFEKWMNIPNERAKLFKLIQTTKASGVVFLSGDRHFAELSMMPGDAGYPFYDLTSSGINQGNKKQRELEVNRHRVATMNMGDNFGMVRIDWSKSDPLITLEIYDIDGDVTIRHKVPLSRLQINQKKEKVNPGDLAAEARKRLDKEWKFEMTVAATGANKAKTMVFLNSEKDFKSDANLTIVLDMKSLEADLKEAKIKDPAKHFAGKKVTITGKPSVFQNQVQVRIMRLEQIRIVEE